MFPRLELDPRSEVPLYRQLSLRIRELIDSGQLAAGERLPATRDLAGTLGLNRATVSAAYALLETDGLIQGHVGRGSFVLAGEPAIAGLNWGQLLPRGEAAPAALSAALSFATSRPSEELFPMEEFRRSCEEVLADRHAARILQLGSPSGYAPLREYLLEAARRDAVARPGDDLLITNGCQQALDLLARVLVRPGDLVALEDPVYPGLKNVFALTGAQVAGLPVGREGLEVGALERLLAHSRPRLLVLTPEFQNPTGASMPVAARHAVLGLARKAGAIVVENDIYGELRYEGRPLPPLKLLDECGDTVLLRSFSKITFPGLRVGWVLAPKPLIARLAEAKQLADLHTDQLAQAVLLRFAESGRLAAHRTRMLAAGAERLHAVLAACERHLPPGAEFTRPQGGMNLWVRLPDPLDAADLLARAQRQGVAYLPGKYFAVSRHEPGTLRLSFASLKPEEIRTGLGILGRVFAGELERAALSCEPAAAIV